MTRTKDETTLQDALEVQALQSERLTRQQSCRELSRLLRPLREEVDRIELDLEKHFSRLRQIELRLAKLEDRVHIVTPQEIATRRRRDNVDSVMKQLMKDFSELSEAERMDVLKLVTGQDNKETRNEELND